MTDSSKKVAQGFSRFNTCDIRILRIELATGEIVDLLGSFVELDIYRSMFNPGMTACLIFGDVLNITNNGPILGGERVYVEWKSPLYEDFTSMNFRVSMVAERQPVAQTNCLVKLELCSEALYFGLSKRLSRPYNTTYSAAAVALWNETGISTPILTDTSEGINRFVTGRHMTVYETIGWMASRSRTIDKLPFVFFEDFDGLVFASWSRILKQTAAQPLLHQPQGTEEDIRKDWMNILAIEFSKNQRDALEFMRHGFGKKTELAYDITTKQLETLVETPVEVTGRVGLNPGQISVADSDQCDDYFLTFSRQDGSQRNIYERELLDYLMQYSTNTILNHGDSQARLGQLVEFHLLAPQLPDATEPKQEQFFSGKYLVTGIKDTIRPNEYRTYREIVQESLLNEVQR